MNDPCGPQPQGGVTTVGALIKNNLGVSVDVVEPGAAGLRVCLDPPDWMRRLARPRLGIRARLWLDMTSDAEIETQIDRLVATIRASAGTG
jgi:hypothetical protein